MSRVRAWGVSQDHQPLPGNSREGKETCLSSLRLAGTREGETATETRGGEWGGLRLSSTDPPRPAHKATCHYGFYQPLSHYLFLQKAVSDFSIHHLLWIKLSPLRFRGEALSPIVKSFRR